MVAATPCSTAHFDMLDFLQEKASYTGLGLGLVVECLLDLHFKSHYSLLRWLMQSTMTELSLREDHGSLAACCLRWPDEVLVESHTFPFSTNSLSLIEVALMMEVPITFQLLGVAQMQDPSHANYLALSMT